MYASPLKKNTLALDACIGEIDVSDVCALIADVPSECVCVWQHGFKTALHVSQR